MRNGKHETNPPSRFIREIDSRYIANPLPSGQEDGPDYELVRKLSSTVDIPVIGEGKVHYPHEAVKMLDSGAYAVVVGGAITRPLEIAQRFMAAIEEGKLSKQEQGDRA